MDPIIIIILIAVVGRCSVIARKKSLNLLNEIEPLTIVWYIYLFSFIILTLYLLYNNNNPIKLMSSKNQNWIKWTVVASIFGVIYAIISTPLLKQLNYSFYSALKSPISLVIAILGSIFLLEEKPSKYIYMGLGLYILAAIVSHQDTIKN